MTRTQWMSITATVMTALSISAQAGTVDFSTATPVDASGINLNGQTGTTAITGAPAWNESSSGLFKIMPGIGPDGSQAMITAQGIKSSSVYYTANAAVTGAAFVAQQTVLKISFDFNVVKSDTSTDLYRIYLGAVTGANYLGILTLYGDGSVKINGEDAANASTSWTTSLAAGVYHNVDLTFDFSSNTWTATFDDDASLSTTQNFIYDASNYTSATNSASYGYKNILKMNMRTDFDAANNQVAFDNFTFDAVPEPAAIAIFGIGAMGLLGMPRVRGRCRH